ncbi:ribokinase [Oleiharenicola sp. Vm1]|uniref:ribokinase n=1 Tax=Oleiharenicola sp. Vm1 TaxID=3398393 RepID=UPI0039F59BBC
MASAPQVVVVGSIMQDLTLACAEFPQPGETIVGQLRTGQGGKGSNQAIACGKTGVRTTFVGAMGDDAYARQVAAFYRRERIGCRLALKRDQATGTAVILINGRGQNEIVIEPGANAALRAVDVPAALIARAKVLITQLEANLATTAHALRQARQAGVVTVLNPAPMRADFEARLLRHVDVLIPNESEFAALVRVLPQVRETGFDERRLHALADAELHALCRRIGVATVIVTLGERGCFVSERGGFTRVPAHRGLKVVDTTGAGDAFCGGFAAGLVRSGGKMVEAVRLGTAVAALSVTKAGAAPSMPGRAELRRFLGRKQAAVWRL